MAFATTAAACYLIACFTVAVWAKLRDFTGFAATVAEIAPRLPAPAMAGAVIAVEVVIALTIAIGLAMGSRDWVAVGAMLAVGAGMLFAGAIGAVLRRGDDVACHCFGDDEEAITPASLLGPAMVAIAGLVALRSDAWPASLALWIASAAAGVYLLIAHRLLPRLLPHGHATRPA